jgi:hypothetical protein
MAEQQDEPIFREIQRWALAVRLLLLLAVLASSAGIVAAGIAAERDPNETVPLFLSTAIGVIVSLGLGVLLWINRLETEVRTDGVFVRYFPFHLHWRQFPAQELSECYARQYRPILEYGGWGIRCGWKGRAYNVSGNEGVQLVFKNGKRLLIGSKRLQELETATRSIM